MQYVCQKVVYNRNGQDFIAEVHNIAGDFEKSKLDPEFKSIKPEEDSKNNGYQYSLVLSGGDNGSSALVTLECDTSQSRENKPSDPTVVSNHNNVLTLHWKTVFACTYDAGEKKPDQGNNGGENKGEQPETGKEGKSGVSIFFTIILILLAVYFVGGAIYNWKVYNARGLDLIPHRDFWLDLPYLIRDLIAHVIDSIMSRRRGSGGYVAV